MGPQGDSRHTVADLDGWVWTVYPRTSSDPVVAIGHSGTEDRAKAAAEHEMLSRPNAPFAIVIGPRGEHETGTRTRDGGFHWRLMFAADADTGQ
jgi:hypothetical protein